MFPGCGGPAGNMDDLDPADVFTGACFCLRCHIDAASKGGEKDPYAVSGLYGSSLGRNPGSQSVGDELVNRVPAGAAADRETAYCDHALTSRLP